MTDISDYEIISTVKKWLPEDQAALINDLTEGLKGTEWYDKLEAWEDGYGSSVGHYAGALIVLERDATNFVFAVLPKLTELPKDAFEELMPALTNARKVLDLL